MHTAIERTGLTAGNVTKKKRRRRRIEKAAQKQPENIEKMKEVNGKAPNHLMEPTHYSRGSSRRWADNMIIEKSELCILIFRYLN